MAEIVPAINVRTFEEARERIKKIEPYAEWCHLDVTDGVFSKHQTWHDPRDLLNFETKLNVEVHLMVAEPEKIMEQWLVKPVRRVIVHLEAASGPDLMIEKCRAAGAEIGFALNPETFWGKLKPWFKKIDLAQILAVSPGPSGQEMREEIYDKVLHIRKYCPKCIIEVDGGINPETAKRCAKAGADILVAGSYIFNSPDAGKALTELKAS